MDRVYHEATHFEVWASASAWAKLEPEPESRAISARGESLM